MATHSSVLAWRIPGTGKPGEWPPTPVFLPGDFHGQRSLAGYRPWGCKELDMTEYCSLPGPSVHGVFQARVLEWGAIAFSPSAGYTGLTPGPGSKIPHAVGQLRPRATTTEPAYSRARALQQEKPPQREACTAQLNSGPRSQQLEKSPWAATKTQRSQK